MTRDEMDALTADTNNKSEKIRRLFAAGVTAADIGRYLSIRYQHVYNVLLRSGAVGKGQPAGSAPPLAAESFILTLDASGRIELPAQILEAQDFSEGDRLICRSGPDGLTIMSRARAVEYLREQARVRMPEDADLFEALLSGPTRSGPDQPT